MTKPHVIDTLAFDIGFDAVQAAREQQDGLAAWIRDALLPVIDEVFDAYAVPGQRITIDTLEIDLGTVPYDGYRQALRQRLKSCLKDWLEAHCDARRQAGLPGTVRIISNEQDDVEQLVFFLRNGRLARHGGGVHVDRLMQRVLRHNGEQLAALLANIAQREIVARRLAHQFSEEVLIEVMRCVVPSHAGVLGALIADLSDVLTDSGVAQFGKARRRMLWVWLLSAVLDNLRRSANLRDIVMHSVMEAARYCGLAYPALLDRLFVHLDRRSKRDKLSLALQTCIDALRTRVTEDAAEAVADARSDPPLAPLKRRWIEALTVGGSADIERLWPALRPYPGMTAETLRRCGQRAEVRAKLSADLSATVLEAMVTLLEPGEHRFIAEIVEHETLFHAEATVDGQGGERVKRQLWAFTLDYLLVDRGSQFNRKSYLDSVLRTRAAHDNVGHSDLLHALTDVLEHVDVASPLKQELLALLGEFAERDGQASPLFADGGNDDSTSAIPARDGVDATGTAQRRDALADGRAVSENGPGSEGHVAGPERTASPASFADAAFLSKQQPVIDDRLSARPDRDDGALAREERQSGGDGHNPARIGVDDRFDLDVLTAWLKGERVALSSNQVEVIVRALRRTYPAQLLKVCQALQAGESDGGGERNPAHIGVDDRFDLDVLTAWLKGERVALSSNQVEVIVRALRRTYPAQLLKVCQALQAGESDDGGERNPAHIGVDDCFDLDVLTAWLKGERVVLSSNEVEAIVRALRRTHPAQLLKIYRVLRARKPDDGAVAQQAEEPSVDGRERNPAFIGAYDRYDLLTAWLSGERGTLSSNEVEAVIQALCRTHPAHLLRFYRALQAGEPAVARLGQGVSAGTLRLLVNAFIGISDKSSGAQSSDLLRAVEACARQAGNRRHYYLQVLQCLVANRLLDFERIVASSKVKDERNTGRAQRHTAPRAVTIAGASSAQGELSVEAARALLASRLRAEVPEAGRRLDDVLRALDVLIQHAPAELAGVLASLPGGADAWVKRLAGYPERVWVRIALALYPGAARLIAMAESIATALYGGAAGRSPTAVTALKWRCFFHCLAGGARISDDAAFVRGFVAALAQQLAVADRNAFMAQLSQQLLLDMLPSTADLHRRLVTLLSSLSSTLPGRSPDHADPQFTETIWLANAGLVLLSPYLPRLFALMGVLDGTAFRHDDAAGWAVHALQYLVDERCDAPEQELVLNKILCGLSTAWPIVGEIELNEEQRGIADSLLQGVIDNWTAIGRTSAAGLRESFLQREGRLQFRRDAWRLTVTPRAYDMLLDRLPWGISLIRQPWMTHAVHVDWR